MLFTTSASHMFLKVPSFSNVLVVYTAEFIRRQLAKCHFNIIELTLTSYFVSKDLKYYTMCNKIKTVNTDYYPFGAKSQLQTKQCDAEKAECPLETSAKNLQSNGLAFKSQVFGTVHWTFNSSYRGLRTTNTILLSTFVY
jgi:hypothetical protein